MSRVGQSPGIVDLQALPGLSADGELVHVDVDGDTWIAGLSVDEHEHCRRVELGLGAIVDRRLLHALWALPGGEPVEQSSLAEIDATTLRQHGKLLVDRVGGQLLRRFRPAGSVGIAIVADRRAEDAIQRLSHVPPIFPRLAVAGEEPGGEAIGLAHRRRVGLAALHSGRYEVKVEPSQPILGSPAVYRWWVAELAYERWLYAHSAHCRS